MIPTFTCDRRKMGTIKRTLFSAPRGGPKSDFSNRHHMGCAQKLTKKKRT